MPRRKRQVPGWLISWWERHNRRQRLFVASLLILALAIGMFFVGVMEENLGLEERPVMLGATFSMKYAQELGLDWRGVFTATLDDLGVRRLRIPAYWDVIEPEKGEFDFTALDWQIEEAAKRDAKVILAIGRKLPRWPECHQPGWTRSMHEEDVRDRILTMLSAVVLRYQENPAVIAWQVENEPLFPFGECPDPDRSFLKRELAVVRSLDARPIMLTESGELSTWVRTAGLADILGISTYRTVWTKFIGFFYWPITPKNYIRRGGAISALVDRIIVSELQAEPWSPEGPINLRPIDEQLRVMDETQLRENIVFVRRMGFPEAYLWGVEWWYWLREHGYEGMWDTGKEIFSSTGIEGRL